MVTLAIYSPKGGSGKSTHTRLMSRVLREVYGYNVLVIDTDPQGSLKDLISILGDSKTEKDFLSIPIESVISDIRKKVYDNYDIVMLDIQGILYNSGNENSVIVELLKIIDIVVMPIRPSNFDVLSALKFKPVIQKINPRCTFVTFLNEFKNNNECKDIEQSLLKKEFTLLQRIKSSVHYPRLTISKHNALDKKSPIRDEYSVFANQLNDLILEYR